MIKGTGTIIDVGVILVTGLLGLLVSNKLTMRFKTATTAVLGLMALVSGVTMVVQKGEMFVIFISLIVGLFVGEKLELESRVVKMLHSASAQKTIPQAFVTATVLSLVGPLAIIGPIQDGLGRGFQLLLLKSAFDGVSTLMLAASLGAGVIVSVIPVLCVQLCLTVFALTFHQLFTVSVLNNLTILGGVVILAVGLDLLKINKLPVINLLPSFLTVFIINLIMTKGGI